MAHSYQNFSHLDSTKKKKPHEHNNIKQSAPTLFHPTELRCQRKPEPPFSIFTIYQPTTTISKANSKCLVHHSTAGRSKLHAQIGRPNLHTTPSAITVRNRRRHCTTANLRFEEPTNITSGARASPRCLFELPPPAIESFQSEARDKMGALIRCCSV